MKYDIQLKSIISGYFDQAQIEVSKDDIGKFAIIIEDSMSNKPNAHFKESEIKELIEKYEIESIWDDFCNQVKDDLTSYTDDMNSGNFSNKNFAESNNAFKDAAKILKEIDFFVEDKELYEAIESGDIFEDTGTDDIDLTNAKEIAKFIVKNIPDASFLPEHKNDEKFIEAIDKVIFSNKNFGVYKDWLIEVDEKFGKDELTEEQHEAILTGKIFESEDAKTDSIEAMYEYAKEHIKDFCNSSKNFNNEDDGYEFIKKHHLEKFLGDEEPDPKDYKKIADEMNKFINGKDDIEITEDDVEDFVKAYFCNSKNYSNDAGDRVEDLEEFVRNLESSDLKDDLEELLDSEPGKYKTATDLIYAAVAICKSHGLKMEEMDFSNHSKNFGNSVNLKLSDDLSDFLKNISNNYGVFGINDIITFNPTSEDLDELSKLMVKYDLIEGSNDKDTKHAIATEVSAIVNNFSKIKLPIRSMKNFSRKNFNDEKYPDEPNPSVKLNFDGTKLPVRARFTMKNPRY